MKRKGWRLEAGGWGPEPEGWRLGAGGCSSERANLSNFQVYSATTRSLRYSLPRHQRGMSLVAAIFLIVIVAMLGSFAVRLGMGQHQTVNLALLSSRALAAANAGVEWSARQAIVNSSCGASTLSLTQGALAGFTVNVDCTATSFGTEGTLYSMTSSARSGSYGQPDYVSRTVTARFFK